MNILKNIIVMFITQPGADDHIIVSLDTATDSETKIEPSLRRRAVDTTVPLHFFSNLSETVVVKGVGTVLRTGSDQTRDIEFTISLILNSEPSDAPSESPTSSSRPTYKGPTVRPTQSREPSFSPSISMMPTEEQTIGLDSCACDNEGKCMATPVTLTITSRTMKICLNASPSNSDMELPYVQVSKHKKIPLSYELDGSSGVVTGTLTEDFFDIGPLADVIVLGKADIFVQQGNKRAEVGFMVQYKLESLTPSPTLFPTTSVAPSDLPPIGIKACQCSNQGECLENVVQHYRSRNVRICLQSTPPQSEIVRVEALYFELTDGVQSAALETQSVISNDQPLQTPGLLSTMFVPPGLANEEDKRFRRIQTVLKGKFFDFDATSMDLRAKGVALVRDTTGDISLRRLTAATIIDMQMQFADEPTVSPTYAPTVQPSKIPTIVSDTLEFCIHVSAMSRFPC